MTSAFVYYHFPFDDHYFFAEDKAPRSSFSLNDFEDERGFIIAPFTENGNNEFPYLLLNTKQAKQLSLSKNEEYCKASAGIPPKAGTEVFLFQQHPSTAYHEAFSKIHDALKSGLCQKAVLSHQFEWPLGEGSLPNVADLFVKACRLFPGRYIALWHTPQTGTWLTVSPELLLSGADGLQWETMALAGTKPLHSKRGWSEKEHYEHQYVVSHIKDCLEPFASSIKIEPTKEIEAGHVVHLITRFSFWKKAGCSITDLLSSLHPTPAVCGTPRDEALQVIAQNERKDRRYYAGYSGIWSKDGCRLYVTLRCAMIKKESLTLYAGGGILKDSNEQDEWEEILQKIQTITSLF